MEMFFQLLIVRKSCKHAAVEKIWTFNSTPDPNGLILKKISIKTLKVAFKVETAIII